MKIFCIEEFKLEFEKLKKKNSYNTIEGDIIEYFFDKEASDLSSGTRLNNSEKTPYIKKRINGAGGFRFYYLLLIVKGELYLIYVHPKSGSHGRENISDDEKASFYKKVLECINNNNCYEVSVEDSKLCFNKFQ